MFVLLYDCCHSAATTVSPSITGYKGVTEVISACGYETIAPPVCEHSFTKALIQVLACASQGPPFSVGELHVRVLKRLMCWTPCLAQDGNGKFVREHGSLVFERQPRRTPICTIVCETEPRRSIVLAPLKLPEHVPESTKTPNTVSQAMLSPSQLNDHGQGPCLKRKRPEEEEDEDKRSYPQVLLAVRLDVDELESEAWVEWIRSAPAECKDIKIDCKYDSFSTLLLVRMPVATWNLLPNN